MNLELYQATLAIALFLVVAEMMTGTFFLLGLAIGFGALVPIYLHTGKMHFGRDLIIVGVVTGFSFALLRQFFKKTADTLSSDDDINTY